jgi:succinate dehydrogenase/fumarate reductase flavoprotein subunit
MGRARRNAPSCRTQASTAREAADILRSSGGSIEARSRASEPPLLAPATLDTKGGPRSNPLGQVLTRSGRPIPGLYAAGNCAGAMSGGGYWAGGATLGPIIAMAYLAGRDAAGAPVRRRRARATAAAAD